MPFLGPNRDAMECTGMLQRCFPEPNVIHNSSTRRAFTTDIASTTTSVSLLLIFIFRWPQQSASSVWNIKRVSAGYKVEEDSYPFCLLKIRYCLHVLNRPLCHLECQEKQPENGMNRMPVSDQRLNHLQWTVNVCINCTLLARSLKNSSLFSLTLRNPFQSRGVLLDRRTCFTTAKGCSDINRMF